MLCFSFVPRQVNSMATSSVIIALKAERRNVEWSFPATLFTCCFYNLFENLKVNHSELKKKQLTKAFFNLVSSKSLSSNSSKLERVINGILGKSDGGGGEEGTIRSGESLLMTGALAAGIKDGKEAEVPDFFLTTLSLACRKCCWQTRLISGSPPLGNFSWQISVEQK